MKCNTCRSKRANVFCLLSLRDEVKTSFYAHVFTNFKIPFFRFFPTLPKCSSESKVNPIQYGLFLKHYGMGGGALCPSLVTLLFLKVEGQNLVASGILMCFLKKWH